MVLVSVDESEHNDDNQTIIVLASVDDKIMNTMTMKDVHNCTIRPRTLNLELILVLFCGYS